MDDAATRDHIQKHVDAFLRGDMDMVAADFSDELRPQLPQLAAALTEPVTGAELLSVDVGDERAVALIRYSSAAGGVTFRSEWQDLGGAHPVIVEAAPAA